jgi:hypothetical protein
MFYGTAYMRKYSDELWAGQPGFDFRQRKGFLFSTVPKPALGPTQLPIQWAQDALSMRAKQ